MRFKGLLENLPLIRILTEVYKTRKVAEDQTFEDLKFYPHQNYFEKD